MNDEELIKAVKQVARYCKEGKCDGCSEWDGSKCKIMKAYSCEYKTELNEDIINVGERYTNRGCTELVEIINKVDGMVQYYIISSNDGRHGVWTCGIGSFLREYEGMF